MSQRFFTYCYNILQKRPHRKGVENDGAYVTIAHNGPCRYNLIYVQPFGSRFGLTFICYHF